MTAGRATTVRSTTPGSPQPPPRPAARRGRGPPAADLGERGARLAAEAEERRAGARSPTSASHRTATRVSSPPWGGETCKYNGVHVVDIAEPGDARGGRLHPGEGRQLLRARASRRSTSTRPAFNGDILVSNNEKCKDKAGFGGMNIYDVTKPPIRRRSPRASATRPSRGQGKKAANEIHSVFAWDAGDKAYAVIVDNEEGPDVDIIDITNPKKAEARSPSTTWTRCSRRSSRQRRRSSIEVFHHDMIVKKIDGRQIMLGLLLGRRLRDARRRPTRRTPIYIGDTRLHEPRPRGGARAGSAVPPEGNAHQSEFTHDNAYLIAADEDFNPYAVVRAQRRRRHGTCTRRQGSDTRSSSSRADRSPGRRRSSAGRAPAIRRCRPATGATQIAVVERGVCTSR